MAFPLSGRDREARAIFYPVPHQLGADPAGPLWGYIRWLMKENGGPAWPSVGRIATDLRTSRRTVQRRIRSLERRGWVVADRSATGRGHAARLWAVLPDREAVRDGRARPAAKGARDDTLSRGRVPNEVAKGDTGVAERVSPVTPHQKEDRPEVKPEGEPPPAPKGRRPALNGNGDGSNGNGHGEHQGKLPTARTCSKCGRAPVAPNAGRLAWCAACRAKVGLGRQEVPA